MFDKLRRARADLTTMNALFPAAERIARDDGMDQPGAEHLLLAEIDLDNGIAKCALTAIGVDPDELRAAVVGQHEEALSSIGVIADDNAIAAALPASGQRPAQRSVSGARFAASGVSTRGFAREARQRQLEQRLPAPRDHQCGTRHCCSGAPAARR